MLDHHHYHQSMAAAPKSNTFSLFFPLPSKQQVQWPDDCCDEHSSSVITSPSSPSSSSSTTGSVDCTLSLGTPSSRRAAEEPAVVEPANNWPVVAPLLTPAHPSSWDVAAADYHHPPSYYYRQQQGVISKPAGGAARGCDASVDRRCTKCGTSSTPLWRNGPQGPKTLCNACGIRFKKEERRAAATAAMESGCGYSVQQYGYGAAGEEVAFPCGGGGGGDADANTTFLAWRLNVVAPAAPTFAAVWPERTSLFHYN